MKKIITSLLLALTLCAVFTLSSCGELKKSFVVEDSPTCIVITASSEQMKIESDTKLIDYMQSLKDSGDLKYTIENGMVTSINDIANSAAENKFWMLYTSDTEHANNAWGTVEYKEKTYGSATLGAESLVIKEDCLYIWYYQSF